MSIGKHCGNLVGVALIVATGLVAGCGSSETVSKSTTVERTSTPAPMPQATTTTTTTEQTRQ